VRAVEFGTEQLVAALAKAREVTPDEARALRETWRAGPEGQAPAVQDEAVQAYSGIRHELGHFIDEIESCMRYHASLARGARVDRLLIVGEEARDKALVRVLGSSLSVPCEVGDPLGAVTDLQAEHPSAPELAVAVGLSLFRAN
jgi:Tfp pilus assembly PilM family ATPase